MCNIFITYLLFIFEEWNESMRKKEIVFITSKLSGGGAEGVCINLSNGLVLRGWNVTLVVLNLENADYLNRLDKRVDLINLSVRNARYSFFKIKEFVDEKTPNKIVVFNYELSFLLVILKSIYFFKFKIIARNISILSERKKLLKGFWKKIVFMQLMNLFYKRVDCIVNQSKTMEDDIVKLYNINKDKTRIINNPVNLEVEKDNSKFKKENYILFVGRLEEVKAIHYIINSFYIISQKFPEYRLKLVGKGSLEKELKDLVNKLGIRDSVDFEGFQGNTIEYYQKAKVTVLTSLYEGFPNVLIESITLGTPIIAFDSPGGISEIVEDNLNGFLVPYQNQDILSEKIEQSLHENWDQELIKKSAKRFSNDKILKEWENLLESM
jgi:glycosyltransferase involved in cell wall biosynthesis